MIYKTGDIMDTTTKFDGRAEDYTSGRPDYSGKLIECMYSKYGVSESSVIADIGSGTGKFSAMLLEKVSMVYSVEPNSDMSHAAEKELCGYTGFHPVAGDAENTGLDDKSVDFITTAQAFHWFDTAKFRRENRKSFWRA